MRFECNFIRLAGPVSILIAGVLLAGCSVVQPPDGAAKASAGVISSNVSSAMLALPESALEAGRYDDALRQFQMIVARDPLNGRAKLGIAEVHLAMNNLQTAMELFTDLTETPELRAVARQGQGLASLKSGQREAARASLAEAVTGDDKLWRAWNALATINDGEQNWDEADQCYVKALATVPNSAIVQNNYGFSLLTRKNYPAAIDALQKALRLSPNLETAQMNLRIALAMQGRYEEALAGLQRKMTPMAFNNVAVAAMSRGDLKHAESYLVKALDSSPSQYDMAAKNLQHLEILKGQKFGAIAGQ